METENKNQNEEVAKEVKKAGIYSRADKVKENTQLENSVNGDTHTNLPVNWDDKFAAEAEEIAATEIVSELMAISTQAGVMKIDKTPIPENRFLGVIISDVHENAFYEEAYDPRRIVPPACYAFSDTGDDLRPHVNCESPKSNDCETCVHNQWGSADKGRGKRCTNIRKLGVVIIGRWTSNGYDVVENVNAYRGQVYTLKVPPTSIKDYSIYKKKIAETLKRPLYSVVTEIQCIPGSPAFKIAFSYNDKVAQNMDGNLVADANEIFETISTRRYAINEALKRPYPEAFEQDIKTSRKY